MVRRKVKREGERIRRKEVLGDLQSLGEEVNERKVIDEAVGEIQRPASEKQAVFRKRSRKRKRWGGGTEKESASNPPYPV